MALLRQRLADARVQSPNRKEPNMNTRILLAALVAASLSSVAVAQMGPGTGHGMMDRPGMGQGMMGRHGMMEGRILAAIEALDLSEEQRGKVTEIRRDLQRKRHALMGSVHELRWQAEDAAKSAEFDEVAARKRYDARAAVRKQMFEAHLDARKRIDAVLTKEQRAQLRKEWHPGRPGPR